MNSLFVKKFNKTELVDKLGICLSLTCGLHCLITISLLAFGALKFHSFFENELVEMLMSVGVLIIGLIAFLPKLIAQRNFTLITIFIVGFLLLKFSEEMNLWIKIPMLIAGVTLIIIAHYLNIKLKTVKKLT